MRKILALLLILLLLASFTVPASAHKGRTDSNGGHRDSATGEYHYHHGYPAHSHYDMDGDGDIDCPYDFDDQTNHNSSNSTGSDSTRTQGLTFNDGYESGYDKGYEDGYDRGRSDGQGYVEKEKDASYEKGYKDGEAAAAEALEPTIKKRVKETITTWIALGALGFMFIIYPAGFILLAIFEIVGDRIKARKNSQKTESPKPSKHKPFTYSSEYSTSNPPRLRPADKEFTLIKRSSFIAAACYKSSCLYVKTTQGDYFMYYNVPKSVYLQFMNAPSMGKFFNQRIANNYPFSRL